MSASYRETVRCWLPEIGETEVNAKPIRVEYAVNYDQRQAARLAAEQLAARAWKLGNIKQLLVRCKTAEPNSTIYDVRVDVQLMPEFHARAARKPPRS